MTLQFSRVAKAATAFAMFLAFHGEVVPDASAVDPAEVYSISATGKTSIVVSDEKASTGRHSLKFTDGPTAARPGQPHLYIKPRFLKQGRGLFSCDLQLDKAASVGIQFRTQASAANFPVGPSIRLQGGRVIATGKGEVFRYEPGRWVTVKVILRLDGSARYDLEIGTKGGKAVAFKNLVGPDDAFKECGVIVVMSPGTEESVFHLDNLVVEAVE